MKVPFMNLSDIIKTNRNEINEKLMEIVDNNSFIGGKEVSLFEEEFASYSNTEYCVGCANGTDALILALRALGIGNGDTVLVPANTFIATAEAVSAVGAKVDFIDIEEKYHTIDPFSLEKYLEAKRNNVKAVIPVHLYGQMADMISIKSITDKYGIKVIEDASQAHGAEINGKRPGSFGEVATYSFYPGKNLGAFGDAGAITTNDSNLYTKLKMLTNHGRKLDAKYEHSVEGYNMRLDTLQAAILRIKLRELEEQTKLRINRAELYAKMLKNVQFVDTPQVREENRHVWHLFVIEYDKRDELKKKLADEGISSGIHYPIPLHLQSAYEYLGYSQGSFPVSEKKAKRILSIPFWPYISDEQIGYVVKSIKNNVNEG